MMVNNKIKQEFERKNQEKDEEQEDEYDDRNREQRVRDLNQLLEQMSGKLPRSENDEYESNSESSDDEKKYKNKKYTLYYT